MQLLVRDHLTPKMNIIFFIIANYMLNIFFYLTIFSKKAVFSEKIMKTVLGHIRPFFRERRRLVPKINITLFITN